MEEFNMAAAGSNDFIPSRLGRNYVEGLAVSVASTTTLGVASGACRDSTEDQDISLDSAVVINFANAGVVNGIDTGAIGASKLYYVYVIANSLDPNGLVNPKGGLVSLSSSPLLPPGYDIYRRIGWARSGGSSTLLTMYQSGNGNVRQYSYDTMIAVLTSGTAQTLTAIDVSTACPPLNNMRVNFFVEFTPATAADTVKFAPFGSTATVIPGVSGAVAAIKQSMQVPVLAKLDTATPKVLYINSAASCDSDIWVQGFEDVI
jgi:hypothetical protein